MYSPSVNLAYGNVLNKYNPIFTDMIDKLETAGIYTSALGDRTVANPAYQYVATYKNAAGTIGAVALDVICDAISRAILEGYRDGFSQGILTKDGASNVSFGLDPVDATLCVGTNLSSVKDVNKALVALAAEITTLKTALGSVLANPQLGLTPQAVINPINTNKLTLE